MADFDAHEIRPEEYDDIPEVSAAMMARGTLMEGGQPVRRGRPPSASPKVAVKLRLDAAVVAAFRAGGPGWQTRMNEVLARSLAARPKRRRAAAAATQRERRSAKR